MVILGKAGLRSEGDARCGEVTDYAGGAGAAGCERVRGMLRGAPELEGRTAARGGAASGSGAGGRRSADAGGGSDGEGAERGRLQGQRREGAAWGAEHATPVKRRVDLRRLRALLVETKPQEVHEAVCEAYREHRSAKGVAPVFGCAPREWGRFLAEYPRLWEERKRTLAEVGQEEVRELRRRLGLQNEESPTPPARVSSIPPWPAAACVRPPRKMSLRLEIVQYIRGDTDGSRAAPRAAALSAASTVARTRSEAAARSRLTIVQESG